MANRYALLSILIALAVVLLAGALLYIHIQRRRRLRNEEPLVADCPVDGVFVIENVVVERKGSMGKYATCPDCGRASPIRKPVPE